MTELYWLTRLDSVNILFLIFTVIGIIASIVLLRFFISCQLDEVEDESDPKVLRYKNFFKQYLKITVPMTIIAILGTTFIPTTKEALLIYGIGGTIDYLKTNPTAKQIPDKCIKALDKWIDDFSNDSTEQKK